MQGWSKKGKDCEVQNNDKDNRITYTSYAQHGKGNNSMDKAKIDKGSIDNAMTIKLKQE